MESVRRSLVLWLSALIVVGLAVYVPVTVWLTAHLSPNVGLLAKSWKEVLLLGIFLLLVWQVTATKRWQAVWNDSLLRLAAAYATLHLLLAIGLYFATPKTLAAGLQIDLRGVLVFVDFYMATKLFWPELRTWVLRSALVNAVIVSGFSVVQLFLPKDFLAHFGYGPATIQPYLTVDRAHGFVRQNSTLRGPNPLGAYGASGLFFVYEYVRSEWKRLRQAARFGYVLLGFGLFVALVTSYSRSAWLGFGCGVLAAGILYVRRHISRQMWIGGAIVMFGLIGGLVALRDNPTISTVFFHDNPTGSTTKSDQQHEASLRHGLMSVATHPLGFGIGSAGSASLLGPEPHIVENQYLFVGYETGWLGIILFVWLYGVIIVRCYATGSDWLNRAVALSGIVLAVIGLLLPVFGDDVITILWWGLAGIALGSAGSVRSSRGGTIKPHGRSKSSHKKTA